MNYSDVINTLIKNNLITKESVEYWYNKLFLSPHPEGGTPWDQVLCDVWNEKNRDSIDLMSDFYDSDCCVVFQGSMSGSWAGNSINKKIEPYITPGLNVLEYGSGGGREVVSVLKSGAKITACDVSIRLLDGVKLLAKEHGYIVETIIIKDDVPVLPIGYDVVITTDCLEHVKKPIDVLNTLSRSLKQGGIMYCEVFFGGHDLSPYHLVENNHLGNVDLWRSVMKNAGLKQIDQEGLIWEKE